MWLLCLLALCRWLPNIMAVVVNTQYGAVNGTTFTLNDTYHLGIQVDSFLGIPFAKPPIDDLRFLNPVEPENWDTVLQADHLRSICIQTTAITIGLTHSNWTDLSEDCLHLNIYTPTDKSNGPYAVMVWLHGGAFITGANIQYHGYFMAAHDVVLVVPNYRLNIFGFSYSEDEYVPGNMGLRDQTMALQFVQNNIAAFGGDPSRVTIAGQSAGGASVGDHLISPESEGLYHSAIPMSGSELSNWAIFGPLHDHLGYLQQVAEGVDCPINDTEVMVDCMRTVDEFDLIGANFRCNIDGTTSVCGGFRPVVDGPGGFIPDMPSKMREEGAGHAVPEMIGMCKMDYAIFMQSMPPLNRTEFQDRLRSKSENYDYLYDDDRDTEDIYQALDFYYTPWPHIDDGEENRHSLAMMHTDTDFGVPADAQAKWHSRIAPVYYYVFDYVSEDANKPDWMEAWHAIDMIYVFGHPFFPQNPGAHAQSEFDDYYLEPYSVNDEQYSYYILELWTNFVKYANPTPDPAPTPPAYMQQEAVIWPAFDMDNFTYINLGGEEILVDVSYRMHEYSFWEQYNRWLTFGDEGYPDAYIELWEVQDPYAL